MCGCVCAGVCMCGCVPVWYCMFLNRLAEGTEVETQLDVVNTAGAGGLLSQGLGSTSMRQKGKAEVEGAHTGNSFTHIRYQNSVHLLKYDISEQYENIKHDYIM